jgi:hypothetical protein
MPPSAGVVFVVFFVAGAFPVSYGHCLTVTVGRRGLAVSILWPFRFRHPPLLLPWSAIERCEETRCWLLRVVAVHVRGFEGRLLIRSGRVGRAILAAWAEGSQVSTGVSARAPHSLQDPS